MALPAVLGSLALYKGLEYAPYAIAAFQALYGLSMHLGERYGEQLRQIKREYESHGFDAIKTHRNEILAAAGYALLRGIHGAYEVYRQVKANLGSKPSGINPKMATVQAALIFFSLLSLSYFTLVPQKTTIHAIVPMTTNVPGLVLSFILLSLGAWIILRNNKN